MTDHVPQHVVHGRERSASRNDRNAAEQREHVEDDEIEQHTHDGEEHVVLIEEL